MSLETSVSTVINAPRETVWDALINPEIVKQYFFGTNLVTTWEEGSPIFFRGEWEGKPYEDKGTVVSFDPMDSMSFNYWSSLGGTEDAPENYQVLTYTLDDIPDGTKVTITQSNIDTEERLEHSVSNWKMVLEALKNLLEG